MTDLIDADPTVAATHRNRSTDVLPAVVELFAGTGSVAHGFSDTGHFRVAALTDIDPEATRTTRANHPDVPYLRGDVRRLDLTHLDEATGGQQITGVLGCPPCQGFSAAGRRRDDDERNHLLAHYFRVVRGLKPKFFVMENVPAVLWKREFAEATADLDGDYTIWSGILNAALYGLPQTRQRAIVIGYHRDLGVTPTPPAPTHAGSRHVFDYRQGHLVAPAEVRLPSLLGHYPIIGVSGGLVTAARLLPTVSLDELNDFVTVDDALADLPDQFGTRYADSTPSDYARALRDSADAVTNHEGWRHKPALVARMSDVPEGGIPGDKTGRNAAYFSQAYGRLHGRGLARTVTTNFHNPGSGRFTHPRANRTLTIREAARLQGIPDSFEFSGHLNVQERLIGNAFPRPWARAIAAHVFSQIGDRLQ